MFGVTLPVPTSWLRTETLRPNPNPSQDFQPNQLCCRGLGFAEAYHLYFSKYKQGIPSKGLVIIGRLARVHIEILRQRGSAGTPYFVSGG